MLVAAFTLEELATNGCLSSFLSSLTSQTLVSANTEKADKRLASAVLRWPSDGLGFVRLRFRVPPHNDWKGPRALWGSQVPHPQQQELLLPFLSLEET